MSRNLEEYHQALETHREFIRTLKNKVDDIVSKKQLSAIMNDTKWLELKSEIPCLPFPPAYLVKSITEEDDSLTGIIDDNPEYLGDWSNFDEEGLPPFFNIEWIKVCPRYARHSGRLLDREVIDETDEFISILNKYHIPFEKDGKVIIIRGYK